MTQAQIASVEKLLSALISKQLTAVGQVKSTAKPKLSRVAAYEAAVMKGMRKKLGKDADIKLRINVLPFGKPAKDGNPATGWIAQGRVVKKGEHGVRGLFHISQTQELSA